MNDTNTTQNHTQITCTTCSYNLQGINLSGCCPECGGPIITDCFWCEYDLRNTAPDTKCPECGVPAITSIGKGPLATTPLDLLQTIHKGFRLVTLLILLYIVWAVVAAIGLVGIGLSSMNADAMSLLVIPISIVSNGIVFGIIFGWWKLASPIPGLPVDVDGSDRRGFLNATLLAFAIATAISMFVSFIPTNLDPDAPFTAVDFIMTGVQLIAFIIMVVMYFAQMRYLQWFAKIAKNNKMHKRAKHMVWSGPLIFILGFMLLFLGPLIVLVLYWNMLEYLRRDIKKIIKSRAVFA